MPASTLERTPGRRAAAWAIHLITASGAVCALLALGAVGEHAFREAFSWLALAMLIDGFDGVLARRLDVQRALPQIDGGLLDNIVDYTTYVLVPACLIHEGGLLPRSASLAAASAICVSAAFQFTHAEAKSRERFRGFPSCWNVVALYLMLLRPAPPLTLATIGLLSAASFAPVFFPYPSRTLRDLLLATLWGISLGALVWLYPEPPAWLVHASLAYVALYFWAGAKS
jgi:phosphatidylcholine synthase